MVKFPADHGRIREVGRGRFPVGVFAHDVGLLRWLRFQTSHRKICTSGGVDGNAGVGLNAGYGVPSSIWILTASALSMGCNWAARVSTSGRTQTKSVYQSAQPTAQ